MQVLTTQAPDEFRRLGIFDKAEYLIRPGDLSEQEFHTFISTPYLVRYRMKDGWGIFQYYIERDGLFPFSTEHALVHVFGPTQLEFFLDWTMEAVSWFVALGLKERPMMMSREHLDKFAKEGVEAVRAQPAPPASSVKRFQHMMRLRRAQHREHMSQYPVGAGHPRG